MPNTAQRILIVAALSVLALIGLVVREGMARASGQEVMLAMAAIDPRALLQGHYVIVSLQEPVPAGVPCPRLPEAYNSWNAQDHLRRWVAIAPSGDHHSFVGAAETREEAERMGPIVAHGEATCARAATTDGSDPLQQPTTIFGSLGIERFHINQAEAQRIEALLREQTPNDPPRIFAIVSVGDDGRARLNGLMVDGERLSLNWY